MANLTTAGLVDLVDDLGNVLTDDGGAGSSDLAASLFTDADSFFTATVALSRNLIRRYHVFHHSIILALSAAVSLL